MSTSRLEGFALSAAAITAAVLGACSRTGLDDYVSTDGGRRTANDAGLDATIDANDAALAPCDSAPQERSDAANAPGLQSGSPWPMLMQGLGHTSVGVTAGADCPTIRWKTLTNGSGITSLAIAADGTTYAFGDTALMAIGRDGTPRWTFELGQSSYSTPSIGRDGTVYFGCNNNRTYAVAEDGGLRWSAEATDIVATSPAIGADGTLYVGDYGGVLFALGSDGSEKWRKPIPGGTPVWSVALAAEGTLYVTTRYGPLYAIRPDGTELWDVVLDPASSTFGPPSVASDGTIYVAVGTALYAVDPSGTVRWSAPIGQANFGEIAIGPNGSAYIVANDGLIYVVGADGTPRPTIQRPSGPGFQGIPAIGSDGTLYVPAWRGPYSEMTMELDAVDTAGSTRWSIPFPVELMGPVIGGDGTIYVQDTTSEDNMCALYAIGP